MNSIATLEQPGLIVDPKNAPLTFDMMFTDMGIDRMMRIAELMASGKATVPRHLQGNVGDCFAVVLQAMRWRMDPFALAQKTHLINGTLGYEAQLVNAVLVTSGAIEGRPNYEWYGDWERIIGRFKEVPARNNPQEKRIVPDWTLEDERGLGIKVWATCRGEAEPRVLPLLLSQAGVRNSPLWGQDPKQQLGYLAIKRWTRLHTPDVLLGVHTVDDLEERQYMRDMGKAEVVSHAHGPEASRSEALRNRLAARRSPAESGRSDPDAPDVEAIITAINAATNAQELGAAIEPFARLTDERERERVSSAYRAKVRGAKEHSEKARPDGDQKAAGGRSSAAPREAKAPSQAAPADDGNQGGLFAHDDVAALIESADSVEALDQAADLIGSLPDPQQREALVTLARTKRAALGDKP